MPTETDIRLRSWLDTNQRDREQMCRSILAIDRHYSDVRPRHPLGGPDGGRDIEAVFDQDRIAYGGVGFANGANDSDEQKRRIREKFLTDLDSAIRALPGLKVFVFLTNLHFTIGEQDEMKVEAQRKGIEHCDVFERERLRIELDAPAGFFIRYQYLSIPLSVEEQASFLSRYGDRIQEVVSTGFERVEKTLNRILFLQEASDILDGIEVIFRLRESYSASEIGHFRAFVMLTLRAVKHDILAILFGSSDKASRFSPNHNSRPADMQPGIGMGIGGGQWEQHIHQPMDGGKDDSVQVAENDADDAHGDTMVFTGCSSAIGRDPVPVVTARYDHDDHLIRFRARLQLRDLHDCMWMPLLNLSLAEKLHSIQVYANGYQLASVGPDDFKIDRSPYEGDVPKEFATEELADQWVRIRPANVSSAFHLRFNSETPRRLYPHTEIQRTPQSGWTQTTA